MRTPFGESTGGSIPNQNFGSTACPWRCPECGEPHFPQPFLKCTCAGPWAIYIPPGQHIHIHCPVHGDVKMYGSSATYTAY